MKHKVVIIGHSYLSRLALIRSLGQSGYDVIVIVTMYGAVCTKKPLDCYSKYVSDIYYCNAKDSDGLIKILMERCVCKETKVVIIPDSDWSASIIDDNKETLSEHFLFPCVNDKGIGVTDWMDKERQKKLARIIGLTAPHTTKLHITSGKVPNLSNIDYPCFTKALTTKGGGKQWFRRCDNEEELSNALASFSRTGDADVLVEDYVDIEREFAVVGLTDGETVIIPGVIQFIENCQRHLGIARKGKILPIDGFEKLIELFKEYVKETHFVGLFDIDFLYSKGEFFFCEMNFRYGGSGYAYTKSGINLPAMFVEMMSGGLNLHNADVAIREEMIYVNERMLLDDLNARHISICDFNRSINTADIRFVPDSLDEGPERVFQTLVLKGKIRYILKKLLRK